MNYKLYEKKFLKKYPETNTTIIKKYFCKKYILNSEIIKKLEYNQVGGALSSNHLYNFYRNVIQLNSHVITNMIDRKIQLSQILSNTYTEIIVKDASQIQPGTFPRQTNVFLGWNIIPNEVGVNIIQILLTLFDSNSELYTSEQVDDPVNIVLKRNIFTDEKIPFVIDIEDSTGNLLKITKLRLMVPDPELKRDFRKILEVFKKYDESLYRGEYSHTNSWIKQNINDNGSVFTFRYIPLCEYSVDSKCVNLIMTLYKYAFEYYNKLIQYQDELLKLKYEGSEHLDKIIELLDRVGNSAKYYANIIKVFSKTFDLIDTTPEDFETIEINHRFLYDIYIKLNNFSNKYVEIYKSCEPSLSKFQHKIDVKLLSIQKEIQKFATQYQPSTKVLQQLQQESSIISSGPLQIEQAIASETSEEQPSSQLQKETIVEFNEPSHSMAQVLYNFSQQIKVNE